MKVIALVPMFVLCVVQPSFAEETPLSKQYTACMEKASETDAMLACIATETKAQDGRLNAAYKKLGAQLEPDRKKQLQAAQRLWVQYRDANCGFYADPDGGTNALVNSNDCVLQATASRARELDSLADDQPER